MEKIMKCFEIKNQIINLDHVSSIAFDNENYRIIFNLDYGVEIDVNSAIKGKKVKKLITDYIYVNFDSLEDFSSATTKLNEALSKISNFIKKPASGNGYINLNRVSSVKFDNSKNRIIFNFANSIDFMNHNAQNAQFKITSEFIYCDFTDPDKFMAESESVKNAMLKL